MKHDRRTRNQTEEYTLKKNLRRSLGLNKQHGGIGYVLLWLLGVPIPVLIVIALLRGCA